MIKLPSIDFKKIRSASLLAILLASISASTTLAIDESFFAGNDILFYDPNGCAVVDQNGNTAIQGTDNAEKIFKFLTSTSFTGLGGKPFNALQAAGALGNFQQESSMDPGAIQPNGDGHGLAQWSGGRRNELFAFAKSEGKQWSDIALQFSMIQKEINASYGGGLISAGFMSVTTPKQASFIFQKVYEGAGKPNQANRDKAAEAYYQKFKDLAPSAPTAADTSSDGGQQCTPTSVDKTSFTDDSFVIYNQYDSKWAKIPFGSKTIGEVGCGPSSMAMIITALTGKSVTPAQTGPYADSQHLYVEGKGSSWTLASVLAKHWDLQSKNIPATVDAINAVLNAGGLVITSGTGATPFTGGGHYITIRGISESGKWMIADSNGSDGLANSNKEWVPQYILDIANKGNFTAITK